MSIEQKLMKDIKSRGGGIDSGRLRNESSAHKAWIASLDHFTAISRAVDSSIFTSPKKDHEHPDTKPSAMAKDLRSFKRAKAWFEEILNLDQDPMTLVSFSTGLFAVDDEGSTSSINPDKAVEVGNAMQAKLDGKTYCDPMESR